MKNIAILCNDGSPLGVNQGTIHGDSNRIGVGGAELALLTLAEYWTEIGHEVVLYNNPWPYTSAYHPTPIIDQRPIATFDPRENRDYLIVFRSPNRASLNAKGKKIWWSCDQYTVGDFAEFGGIVDQIVTISPYHREYFQNQYRLDSTAIDLPVREQDYVQEIEKVPYRMLFSSVPGRGLDILAQCYPAIKERVPEASLVITSDYRLWGASPNNEVYRSSFFDKPDVAFMGAVSRNRLVEEQYKADIMSYPCCLLPTTKVDVPFGSQEIGTLCVGDYVLGGNGEFSQVDQIHTKQWSDKILSISLMGNHSEKLELTPDHKVLGISGMEVKSWKSRERYKESRGVLSVNSKKEDADVSWIEARDLVVGDYIAAPCYQFGSREEFSFVDYGQDFVYGEFSGKYYVGNRTISSRDRGDSGVRSDNIVLDYEAGLFFGYFLAEGSASNNSIVAISFHEKEILWAEECLRIGNEVLGLEGSLYEKSKEKCVVVTFSSKHYSTIFQRMFGNSSVRVIPIEFMEANEDFIKGLLVGYWRGDCHVGKYDVRLSTASEVLARQNKVLLSGFGFAPRIGTRGTGQSTWSVLLSGSDGEEFSEWLEKKKYVVGDRFASRTVIYGQWALYPIDSIEERFYDGLVYDIGIDSEHHSFSSCGVIVHNSYDELFCIACAESQWVGSLPITTTIGSLITTNMGIKVEGDFRSSYWMKTFVDAVAQHLLDRETLVKNQDLVRRKARERFSLEKVNARWNEVVFD